MWRKQADSGAVNTQQSFKVPEVMDNASGWGPNDVSLLLASQLHNFPYAPFSKDEKLGRVVDWTRGARDAGGIVGEWNEVESYIAVDSKPPTRRNLGNRRSNQPVLPQRKDEEVEAKKKEEFRRGKLSQNRQSVRREGAALRSSVDIQPDWTVKEQIMFNTLSKLSFNVGEAEDLATCGVLEHYDKSYDRVTPKTSRRLEQFKNKVTKGLVDDPVILRLAKEDKATVFATDTVLATLMCAPRSVYSWDMVIQRVGNALVFDKRDDSQLDLLPVNETSQEPLPEAKEDINSAYSLSVEAAYINQKFSQQVLVRNGTKVEMPEPNPFAGDSQQNAPPGAYRYRRWKLDDDTYLVVRCELHAVLEAKTGTSFVTLNALNEFDPKLTGVDWRQKLDAQPGAVLATELKNNGNKLAKWTAQALLASADVMKLGYVSRVHPKDRYNHVVLAVQGYKPKDFAMQINLNTSNMWGIVKSIVDLCLKLPEGKYVLVKDPQRPQVRLYEVPADAFKTDCVEEEVNAAAARADTEEEADADEDV